MLADVTWGEGSELLTFDGSTSFRIVLRRICISFKGLAGCVTLLGNLLLSYNGVLSESRLSVSEPVRN